MPAWISRSLSWIAAAFVGAVYGTAGTIVHGFTWGVLPVGLIIGGLACAALLIAVRTLTHDRWATLATSLGMLVMLLLVSGEGPGGSVIVPNTVLGQVWIYLVLAIAFLVIIWPDLRRLPVRTTAATASEPVPEPVSGDAK